MEIDHAIFQDLESFGKRGFQIGYEKIWSLFGKILKYPKIDTT